MDEIKYEQMQEDVALGQAMADALQAILDDNDAEDVDDLYRTLYKYTECGPWLSVKLHDGSWKHCYQLHGIKNGNVRALLVGSIVEGIDSDVRGEEIDLMKYAQDEHGPEQALADFDHQVEQVNNEACALWNMTHGCEQCAALHHQAGLHETEYGPFEGCDGITPVHPDCPACEGSGAVI